jgi:hypothetical protein
VDSKARADSLRGCTQVVIEHQELDFAKLEVGERTLVKICGLNCGQQHRDNVQAWIERLPPNQKCRLTGDPALGLIENCTQ